MDLKAQQRYFSYREILVAIVSQNSFVLVLMGYRRISYRTITARHVAKWGIAQMCLCETNYQRGDCTIWGAANLSFKVSRNMGHRGESIAVSRDMGPLSTWKTPTLPENIRTQKFEFAFFFLCVFQGIAVYRALPAYCALASSDGGYAQTSCLPDGIVLQGGRIATNL